MVQLRQNFIYNKAVAIENCIGVSDSMTVRDIIAQLCLMYIPRNNKRGVEDTIEGLKAKAGKSIDARVKDIEVAEEDKKPILAEEPNRRHTKTKPRETDFLDYFNDSAVSRYGRLKTRLSTAYCAVRERLKKIYRVRYKSGFVMDPAKETRKRILDWCLILPRKGDPRRLLYLSLL